MAYDHELKKRSIPYDCDKQETPLQHKCERLVRITVKIWRNVEINMQVGKGEDKNAYLQKLRDALLFVQLACM